MGKESLTGSYSLQIAADASKISGFCNDNSFTEEAFFAAAFALANRCFFSSEESVFSVIRTPGGEGAGSDLIRISHSCDAGEDTLKFIGEIKDLIEKGAATGSGAEAGDPEGTQDDGSGMLFSFRKEGQDKAADIPGGHSAFIEIGMEGQSYRLELSYDPEVFSEYIVKSFAGMYGIVAGELAEKKTLKDVKLVGREDEKKILGLYDTDIYVPYRPAYRLLQDAADEYAEKTVLIAVDRNLTYRELNEEANALGHVLRDCGVTTETIVAVLADRDSYAYVMREGVLKSGGAFMPIDPEYPEDRIRFIFEDSGCKRLVTTKAVRERRPDLFEALSKGGVSVTLVEEAVEKGSRENINADVPENALAYVIYTSGSTGKPKGVMLENHNLVNYADDNPKNHETLDFVEWGEVVIPIAPFTFDVSVLEEFVPYSRGMTHVLATMEQFMDADAMRDLIVKNNVDVITCTPTYILNMVEIEAFRPAIEKLKSIDVGSEAFPPVLYDKLIEINPSLHIVNTYGPTECTVTSTRKEVVSSDDITIGTPIANAKLATVDRDGRLQPQGAIGELVIMGAGVGRGYIGRDDLTKRNFIRLLGLPAYRSGDLSRIKENGEIDFHGRMDDQVKLRGLRVELGEIQSVIGTFPGIRASVVTVERGETDFLAAYFTADNEIDIRSLREHLASKLTDYMVPQAYMQLDEMPLTANGKVDKRALPKLAIEAEEIVPPENEMQEGILADAVEAIGGIKVGITTDLLSSGLSSIGCIRLCALLSERFHKSIKVSEIFEHKTIKGIEKMIREKAEEQNYAIRSEYPLSMTQTGIYIECERHPGTTIYNIPCLYRLDPEVDLGRLVKAIEETVKAHPYLMMRPVKDKRGELHALRRDDLGFEVKRIRCASLPEEEELVRPFDLNLEEPLFRAEIYETDDGNHFLFDTHHIVSDGSSIDILIEDIERAYQGEEISKEKYTGYDYALDEEKARAGDRLKKAKEWHDSIFDGLGGETLPVKDGVKGAGPVAFGHILGDSSADQIERFCKEKSLSLNAFYTAAFGLALKAFTAGEKAVFCAIYNGRNDSRLSDTVSMLVKTLPVYLECQPEMTTYEFIRGCEKYLLSAMSNDIFSFAEVRSAYGIKADALFAFQGEFERSVTLGGKDAGSVELSPSETKAALGVDVYIDGGRTRIDTEYDPELYSEYTVNSLARMLDHIAGELVVKEKLKDVTLVSAEDVKDIQNLHDSAYPVKERPAYRLLQDCADKYPDRKALVATDRTLTYRELNEEANAIGDVLRKNGAGPETIVAVLAERDSFAYVMRQGVLKSGGAFLPIDPEYPEDRIRFILEDSGAKLVLTSNSAIQKRPDFFLSLTINGIHLVEARKAITEGRRDNLNVEVPYSAPAYVIYTSGSTGRPKGVVLTNKNLVNFVDDDEKNREIQGYTKRGHVSLAIAALTFDFSIMEEFVPIANGLTVVLATQEEIMNPTMLAAIMRGNHVDVMSCTPSYLLNLLDMAAYTNVFTDAVKNIKSVDMGAEAFPPTLYDRLKAVNPDIFIMNGYGPTEATISCTMQVIDSTDDITIGIPNVNVSVATIDREGRLQPLGAMGEMVIIGDGVGRGYIGRDDLTKKCFITMFGKPAYRSGDLVRIRKDGNIEFHGRIDDQVKLRGLRVELGEIESVINSYPGILSCIVIVVKQETDYLAAYFTADGDIDINSLKEHLSSRLTAYMVPQMFMQLPEMPLTANGKIDKKKLPKPSANQEEVALPKNEIQKQILEVVKDVLGGTAVGVTTDLFEVGLSSIGCIKLCAILSEKFNTDIRISDIFEKKTVTEIETLLRPDVQEAESSFDLRAEYPLSMTQMGIFLESIRYMGTTVYNIPFLYRLADDVDMHRLKEAIQKIFAAHPYLFMTLKREDDNVEALRDDSKTAKIDIRDELPDTEELVRPFDLLSGEDLYRVGLYDTKEGKYIFLDLHHIISDGESFNILFEDLNAAYQGSDIEKEEYTGYEAALKESEERASDRFANAKEWYDDVLRGTKGIVLPAKEENAGKGSNAQSAGADENIGMATCISSVRANDVRSFCEQNRLSLNAFFTAVFGLSLKAYTGTEDALFTAIYNGRSDPRTERSVSMFVKTLPILLKPLGEKKINVFVEECSKYLLNAMANDIVSFSEISSEYGITSDILFAYQGENDDEDLVIGTGKAEEIDLSLSQAKSPFGLDVSLDGDSVVYDYEYDPTMYTSYTTDRFTRLMDEVLELFLTKERLSEVYISNVVNELSAKPVNVEISGNAGEPGTAGAAAGVSESGNAEEALAAMDAGSKTQTSGQAGEAGGEGGDVEKRTETVLVSELVAIIKRVLKSDNVKEEDNFFEIGGTSLTAAQVMMAAMSKDIPVLYKDVFDHPSARDLARHVVEKLKDQYGPGRDADLIKAISGEKEGTASGSDTSEPGGSAPGMAAESASGEAWTGSGTASGSASTGDAAVSAKTASGAVVSGQDKAAIAKALSYNTSDHVEELKSEGLGKILLTGASGFLGMHVLKELLSFGSDKIYCLMHGNGISSEKRLKGTFFYYFDGIDEAEFRRRVAVIEGDITKPESLKMAHRYYFNTVINCAACVKHFADPGMLKTVNTDGVYNLTRFCLEKKARLIHVSTVSVAGDSVGVDAEVKVLRENCLDMGQEVESNAYVYTKYLAEKLILEAIEKEGLDAKIMRAGNLMSRFKDGEFQINFNTNNFMNTLKAYVELGCFPVQQLDERDEFSPIDEVARAIVLLAGTNREFTVFHVYNSHTVEYGDIIYALKDLGFDIDIVEMKEFNERLRLMIADESLNKYISPLVNYNLDDDDIRVENVSDNSFTVKALYRLGFKWSSTSREYIETSIQMLDFLGFFDENDNIDGI